MVSQARGKHVQIDPLFGGQRSALVSRDFTDDLFYKLTAELVVPRSIPTTFSARTTGPLADALRKTTRLCKTRLFPR